MILCPSDPVLISPHQGLVMGVGEGSLPALGCPDLISGSAKCVTLGQSFYYQQDKISVLIYLKERFQARDTVQQSKQELVGYSKKKQNTQDSETKT